jgi:hypothetical protein
VASGLNIYHTEDFSMAHKINRTGYKASGPERATLTKFCQRNKINALKNKQAAQEFKIALSIHIYQSLAMSKDHSNCK